jgi:DNA-binding transcriptional LysR family regulator
MSALERELGGVQLFVRAAKSVRPTAAGWRVARVSRVALPVLDSIDRDVRAAAKD